MALKDSVIRVRVDSTLKKEVAEILNSLGMSYSEAISLFLNQVRLKKGLPFEVKIPNEATIETFEKTDRGEELIKYESKEALFEDLRKV
ncbi:MAG: type II toxin-antitoxin system RelB/DinJ family antitoxin [Calditrichaceae bacterium]|nr:type II toxin-antitoxin system RelB/DinJ family antitoxin [Calditrichia bacterium]NUQ43092.1 type II toxin-antitoxin system RelB/DinJ family antitoxin [Calditrichaceae bacterium]